MNKDTKWWADKWEQFDYEQKQCEDCEQYIEDSEHAGYFTVALVFLGIGAICAMVAFIGGMLLWNWIT